MIYDKAKYHYEGEYPNDLPLKQAFVHTGMFLGWIIENELFSQEFNQESKSEIEKLKDRQMTGTQIYMYWDGVLASDMLNDLGNQFTMYYFDFDNGMYLDDYEHTFSDVESLYYVEDTWDNYVRIKEVIDNRYLFWKKEVSIIK